MKGFSAVLRDGWRLATPYFNSEEKWTARGLLLAIIVMRLGIVRMHVIFNYWNGAFFNSLQNKDSDTFWNLLLVGAHTEEHGWLPGFLPFVAILIVVISYFSWLQQYLSLRWRRWLTRTTVDAWLHDRAYYRIALQPAVIAGEADNLATQRTDNPDQRISEDVRDFADQTVTLSVSFLGNIVSLVSFAAILLSLSSDTVIFGIDVPGALIWLTIGYAIFGTVLTHLVGRKLAGLNFQQQRVEANFRFGLFRVRENTESIALLRGENAERGILGGRFDPIVRNTRAIMTRNKNLSLLTTFYEYGSTVFPYAIQAPRYFAGAITLGTLSQTSGAFASVQGSLSWFINVYASLAQWRSIVARLTTFQAAVAERHAPQPSPVASAPSLEGVTLALPSGAPLLRDVTERFNAGQSTVIQGPSGSGKSTLLRTLSGIWPFSRGQVTRAADAMFLPQRPYIPLGTLRAAITYPRTPDAVPDAAVRDALAAAGLAALAPHLDDTQDFAHRLSGGEQQRLAIARALLAKPAWLFLDEATSALDPAAEAEMYRVLKASLPHTTIVSVAHRESVASLHDRRLVVEDGALRDATLPQAAE